MENGKAELIDRKDRTDKSVFHSGLDWFRYLLKHNIDFDPIFCFQPIMDTHVR